MSEKRTCVGIRVLSMLLVVCMVLGMAPLNVFAAETAPAELTNLQRIQEYAKSLFDANFAKAFVYEGKFTWCKEDGKSDKWRYYDGLMLDAYLAMGMAGTEGNALEFAANYYNSNIEDNGEVHRFDGKLGTTTYLNQEVDSVRPARGLFDLLGTAADQDKYHEALRQIYKSLSDTKTFKKLPNVNNNVRHKPQSGSWETWAFALDGIYMALPFLMEYANAVEKGKLVDPTAKPDTIRADVYNRLIWVEEHMKDSTTGLYYHGTTDDGKSFNGQFWTRAMGWYAVALVEIIELMPAGEQKTKLTANLVSLFDSMLKYQDKTGGTVNSGLDSGLWYNVTNYTTDLANNKLETSGSACMAYAMMKAYNNGWVGQTYGEAGLKAFNGIVEKKLINGEITDIYKSASVYDKAESYSVAANYVTDEAKGVGVVLLAAAQVEKTQQKLENSASLMGTAEPTGGMVKAPAETISVQVGGQPDLSGVKATVIYDDGTIQNVTSDQLACSVPTAEGAATLDVLYQGKKVGTLNVNVTDPSVASGTVTTTTTTSNTAPAYEDLRWVAVSAGASGSAGSFNLVTSPEVDVPFVFHLSGKNYYPTVNAAYTGIDKSQSLKWTTNSDGTYKPDADITTYWYLDAAGHLYTKDTSDTKHYLTSLSTLGTNVNDALTFKIVTASGKTGLQDTANSKYIQPASSELQEKDANNGLGFYSPAATTSEYAHLAGQNYTINVGDYKSDALITKIQSECTLSVSQNSDGTGATSLAWSAVTTAWDKALDTSAAGTYTMTVTYKTKALGQIVVVVNGQMSVDHPVVLDIEPNTLALDMNGTKTGTLTAGITVDGAAGTGTVTWTSSDANVATVENGQVTAVGAGTATITAKLTGVTIGDKNLAPNSEMTASVIVNVTGGTEETTETTEPTVPTLTITSDASGTKTVEAGKTLQLTVTASAGTLDGGTITWSSDKPAVATVSDTGLVTGVGAGTAIITATWTVNSRAASDTATATFEVTVTGASSGDGLTYKLVNSIEADKAYVIVAVSGGKLYALTNTSVGDDTKVAPVETEITTYASDKSTITFASADVASLSEWTFTADSTSYKIHNDVHYLRLDTSMLDDVSQAASATVTASSTAGVYHISLDGSRYVGLDGNGKWFAKNNSAQDLYLYEKSSTPTPPPTPTYSATVTADPTEITVGGTSTLTASMSDGTGAVTGATFAWSITSGAEYGDLSDTTGESVTLTGKAAGTVKISVTATATSGETATSDEITIIVNAADPGPGPDPAGCIYQLDTDGIDSGDQYVIVEKVGEEYFAFRYDPDNTSNSTGYIAKVKYDAATNRITFVDSTHAPLSEWLFTKTTDVGENGYESYQITNGDRCIRSNNDNPLVRLSSGKTADHVPVKPMGSGEYRIARYAYADEKENEELYCDGSKWTRDRGLTAYTHHIMLFKRVEVTAAVTAPANLSMDLFGTTTPEIEALYDAQTLAPGSYTLSWTISDDTVVSVENGVLTALKPGNATVTVQMTHVGDKDVTGENLTATIAVTVAAPTLTLSQSPLDLYLGSSVGSAKTLTAVVSSASGAWTQPVEITWESGDNAIATVDATGKASAVAVGSTTVTAKLMTFNGQSVEGLNITASCDVTVAQRAVKSVVLKPKDVTVAWDHDGETTEERASKVMDALRVVTVTVTYNDGTTFNPTVGELLDGSQVQLVGIDQVITDTGAVPKDYTVQMQGIAGQTPQQFDRNIYVHVVDPTKVNSDGIIRYENSVMYKKATTIENGKEYIIVAFPTAGNTKDGVALSNGNASNENEIDARSVNVTIEEDTANPGYWKIGLPADTSTDVLLKWTFSHQTADSNWFIYNFRHRLSAATTKLLQSRHNSTYRVFAKAVDGTEGAYMLTNAEIVDGKKTKYIYYTGSKWTTGDATAPAAADYHVYLYERVPDTTNQAVVFTLQPEQINTHIDMKEAIHATVTVAGVDAYQRNIVWRSSDPTIAEVDINTGVVSAHKPGTVTITATLYNANGEEIIPNVGTEVTKTVTVNVGTHTPTYALTNNEVTVRLGGVPNYSEVKLHKHCDDHGDVELLMSDPDTELDPLSAKAEPSDSAASKPLNRYVAGVYYVPVYYLKDLKGFVKVTVDPSPYHGLTVTDSYPEYPNAGGVRLRKFGTGGAKFLETGLAQIELSTAGVSTQSNVDVVLIVDVSNSMGWSMNWFEGMSQSEVDSAKDDQKIDLNAPDKLDMAMQYAGEFADTLLGAGNSGNTLSFVTFAGVDLDHRADNAEGTNYADSVKLVFCGVTSAADAKASFGGTKFTEKSKRSDHGVNYSLTIAGTDGQALPDADRKTNRGNTNYDYAFGQAIEAVTQIKQNYQTANGKSYDESGRQLHVVFMTDGAPSHYNGAKLKVTTEYDTIWNSPDGNRYSNFTPEDKGKWMDYISWSNTLATELYSMVTDLHLVGFDLDHGGFGGYSFKGADLIEVLRGMVQNRVLDGAQADKPEELKAYLADLANALTLAATDAKVTDVVGDDFELFTKTQGGEATQAMPAEIYVKTYELYTKADADAGLCTENQVGERKPGGEKILETVTFYGTNKPTSSELKDENGVYADIWNNHTKILTAKYFTYDFNTKTFVWNIGDMENKEYTLSYYAYLTGSYDDSKIVEGGRYYTNKSATLDYVDIYGDHASRPFPKPEVAWDSANIGVRFFLVNSNGDYINRAGEKFTEAANRVFLSQRVYYNYTLNKSYDFKASKAFLDAALGANYSLYLDGDIKVTNSRTGETGSAAITQDTKGKISAFDLVTGGDTGNFLHAIVDIPVVLENLGSTENPLNPDTAVMDYGLPITIDVLGNDPTRKAINGNGDEVDVALEVMGFAPYSEGFNTKNYVSGSSITQEPLETACGTFSKNADGKVVYTPNKMLNGVQKVFVAVKLTPSVVGAGDTDYRILLNTLTIIPATSVYYETDGNMAGAFTMNGDWTAQGTAVAKEQDASGGIYGYDSHYTGCPTYSNGAAYTVTGKGTANTNVTFTFTGTGFDLISRTGAVEGIIRVTVTNSEGVEVKRKTIINTANTELYQLPVFSTDEPLPYDTYTVTIGVRLALVGGKGTPITGDQFCFDAIRVYGTAGEDTDALAQYLADHEANAQIQEIRDLLISADDFSAGGAATGSLFMDLNDDQKDENDKDHYVRLSIKNYTSYGPKNEVYLGKDNVVAFKLENVADVAGLQIGAKSADGNSVTMEVTIKSVADATQDPVVIQQELSTATAMFYDLLTPASALNRTGGLIVIVKCTTATESGGILSLTDLKLTTDDGAAQASVVSDAETYVTARNLLAPSYDIQSATFDEDNAMTLDTAEMTVTTTNLVERLEVRDSFGNVIPASAVYLETAMGERIWTVTLRTTNIGEVSYTVVGYGADGQTGIVATDNIVVSY